MISLTGSRTLLGRPKLSRGACRAPQDKESQEAFGKFGFTQPNAAERRATDGAVCKIASERDEFADAFRLVYQCYIRCGLVRPNPYLMRITPYQMLLTTEVFVAMHEGQVAATVSLVRDGELGLPMEAVFGEEVAMRRLQGLHLGEVSCLASRERSIAHSLPIVLRLMSLMAQCAQRRGVNQLMIAVHPKHVKFYRLLTAFEPIADPRAYRAVCDKPAVAMVLDLDRAEHHHPKLYRRFFGVPFSEQAFTCQSMASHSDREFRAVMEANGDIAWPGAPAEMVA